MAVLLTPFFLQFSDANGVPYAGGMVFSYAAGTTTPKNTYTDFSEGVVAANPIILDSAGRATIWVNGSYDFVLQDSLGNTVKTTQNVTSFSVPAASANSYFQSFSGDGTTTAFTLSQNLGTDENSVLVYVDAGAGKGYEPQNPSAFTLNGTTITFASAPAVGTNNIYIWAPSLLLGAASAAAAAAATSETNAAASATLASQWASQTSGIVATVDFSSKAWAIGGTGVTNTSGKGASKEWATKTGGTVDTVEYSAKEYSVGTTVAVGSAKSWATLTSSTVDGTTYSAKEFAQGSQAATGGSSMNWAQQTGADVTGAATHSRSSKSWSQDNLAGSTYGGSAKDWAQSASQPDGVNQSAKTYATNSATSASASAASQVIASAAAAAATAAAVGLANEWLFASSTTMADPGTGNFRLDNASFGSVANIALSALTADSGNPNLHSFMLTWDDSNHSPRGIIRIEKNATNFILLGVNGNLTDGTTWLQFPVTVIASAGSFTAADVTFIGFTPYGNDGTGTLNASGTPTVGALTKWASSTTIANADLSGDVTTSGTLTTTIAANAITTTKINNSAVTLAKIANAAANSKLLGAGASGSGSPYAELTLGTNLSITGTTINAAGGSSELVLLATATASSSASLVFTSAISSAYSAYMLVFNNLLPSTAGTIRIQCSTDNGSTFVSTLIGQGAALNMGSASAPTYSSLGNGVNICTLMASTATATSGYSNFVAQAGAGFAFQSFLSNNDGLTTISYVADKAAVATNAIKIVPSAGTFTSGSVYLYGIKNT